MCQTLFKEEGGAEGGITRARLRLHLRARTAETFASQTVRQRQSERSRSALQDELSPSESHFQGGLNLISL